MANTFAAAELLGVKGGGYSLLTGSSSTYSFISTTAGYFELPTKTAAGTTVYRKYSYGYYVDYATVPLPAGVANSVTTIINNAQTAAVNELVRGVIASAIKTFI